MFLTKVVPRLTSWSPIGLVIFVALSFQPRMRAIWRGGGRAQIGKLSDGRRDPPPNGPGQCAVASKLDNARASFRMTKISKLMAVYQVADDRLMLVLPGVLSAASLIVTISIAIRGW